VVVHAGTKIGHHIEYSLGGAIEFAAHKIAIAKVQQQS